MTTTTEKPGFVRVYEAMHPTLHARRRESGSYIFTNQGGVEVRFADNPADSTPEGAEAFREVLRWTAHRCLYVSFTEVGDYWTCVCAWSGRNNSPVATGPTEADALCAAICAWLDSRGEAGRE